MLLVVKNYKKVININKQKINKLIEKNNITLKNLERSIRFALNNKEKQYQIINSAFTRTNDILNKREKEIKSILKLRTHKKEYNKVELHINNVTNSTHQLILKLFFEVKLKPSEIINLKPLDIEENILKLNQRRILLPNDILIGITNLTKKETKYIFMSNRNKKYSIRTIQKIRENYLKSI